MQKLKDLLFRLCAAPGVSGAEHSAAELAAAELAPFGQVKIDPLGSVTACFGPEDAEEHVLLDAHLDQIGLTVSSIDENGFLSVKNCGGVDARILPGAPVVVCGKEQITGSLTCTPQHLAEEAGKKAQKLEDLRVDPGLDGETVRSLVAPGDRVLLWSRPVSLLGNRLSCAALDDRCGAAALIRCAELLHGEPLACRVTILLSTMEETGGQGARVGAYAARATQAIAVDVSFAAQPGVPEENCGALGCGPMIGLAPILNRAMSRRLLALAKELGLPHTTEVMGGRTSTDSDEIAIARGGVRTALVSIPLRYMHTAVETIDAADVEHTAQLLAAYVKEVGTHD